MGVHCNALGGEGGTDGIDNLPYPRRDANMSSFIFYVGSHRRGKDGPFLSYISKVMRKIQTV